MDKNLDELARHLFELLPKLKEDDSEMGKQFYKTAVAYIRNSKQLYKIIEISDKNQSAIMDMSKKLKKSREKLKKAKEIAEEANRSKSIFLSNMSHEIRTPLNSIIGFTDLLINLPMEDTQKQYVENVNISAHSLLDIINDILDFSKIEAGKLELEMITEDIVKLVEDSLNIVKFQARNKGLRLKKDLQPEIPRFGVIDAVRLRQVLVNLLGNAIKFTEKGEVKISLSFDKIDEKRGIYNFTVEDTGMGIPEEKKDKLFKAFSQADVSITRQFGGTGLGLAISGMLVNKMGGNIQVKSEPGKGSTFYFSIETPYFYKSLDNTSTETVKNINKSEDLTSTILIAEDVNINMQLIKAIIDKYFPNCKILEAQNGQQVYQLIQNNDVDLILMDVQMPVMNGLDATIKIRQDELNTDRHIIIIALTAAAIKEDIQNCLDAGMDDFLTKPIKQKNFFEKIDRYLKKQLQPKNEKTTKDEDKENQPIKGVNFQEGLLRLNKKEDLYINLLCSYAEECPKDLQQLKNSMKENSTAAIEHVHRIKGLAYNLSINLVGQKAEEVERALKRGEEDTLDSKFNLLNEEIDNFRKSINEYLSQLEQK